MALMINGKSGDGKLGGLGGNWGNEGNALGDGELAQPPYFA